MPRKYNMVEIFTKKGETRKTSISSITDPIVTLETQFSLTKGKKN